MALARSCAYRWLSLGLRYPDAIVLAQLTAPALRGELPEACRLIDPTGEHHLHEAATQLVRRLTRRGIASWEDVYINTFGHIARGQLSLYETEYGDSPALRGLHEFGDIAGFYRAFGLEVTRDHPDRVDHAAIECAFLHVLCRKEAHALEHHGPEQRAICREAQERFLRDHLGWWMPSMARRILDIDASTVLAAWGQVGLRLLASERQRFHLPEVSERLGLRRTDQSLEAGCQSCSVETACPGGTDAVALRPAAD